MPTALGPLFFLPFHLVHHHLVARTFPNKPITYPLHLVFAILQYCVEHFSAELPSIAAYNQLLVGIAIGLGPVFYYLAYHRTTGPKSFVWAGVAIFLVTVPLFKGLELGFPKDDPLEQAAANLNWVHSYWHLLFHSIVVGMQALTTYYVPWNPSGKLVTPSRASLSTMPASPTPVRSMPNEACSPKRAVKAMWAKPKDA